MTRKPRILIYRTCRPLRQWGFDRKKAKHESRPIRACHLDTRGLKGVSEEMYELKFWLLSKLEILVVYHLHGQSGRLTVWENGEQNSGLVN